MRSPKPFVVALCGSVRPSSRTRFLALEALEQFAALGCVTALLDPKELNLPFCTGDDTYQEEGVVKLRSALRQADAILLVTPEYHGSMSGILKNALDLCEGSEFKDKIVAVLAVSGGAHSHNALNVIAQICRQLHAWVMPHSLVVPYSDKFFSETGELIAPEMQERLQMIVEETLMALKRFCKARFLSH